MTESDLQPFRDFATELRRLAVEAHRVYAAEISTLIATRGRDATRIEHVLDGLLDCCYEASMVTLYRVLCRYYFTLLSGEGDDQVSSARTSPAAETSDPPAAAFLERRPLKQEGSLAHRVNCRLSAPSDDRSRLRIRN